ncbi:protein of unknown function [Legionella fallonii LLAP-10]|uniref:Uncharacterized protein n=1 Tax=Legionella fallonii LLAP-10 TaxID=1212491 RepID=A0A098G4L8_9GAMM|nr:protein of unknown function [Legionella fallonii LLAP-10]
MLLGLGGNDINFPSSPSSPSVDRDLDFSLTAIGQEYALHYKSLDRRYYVNSHKCVAMKSVYYW